MFIDCLTIYIEAGHGGSGAISFRREKSMEKGGPDGGDGGCGGSIIFSADKSLNTLNSFRNQRNFHAENGKNGSGNLRHGSNGKDLIINVPPGTIIRDVDSGQQLAELIKSGDTACLAKGGRGGQGNYHYRSSTNQTPRRSQPGEEGEILNIELELKLIADVGLVGLPNAGKSTLVSRVSSARPKIADYPFTTLEPQLGMVFVDELASFVVADIPGLIQGAAVGVGLGYTFLRHIERTRILLHLVDLSDPILEPEEAVRIIRNELESFSPELLSKPYWLVGTKVDALQNKLRRTQFEKLCYSYGHEPIFISGVTGEGIRNLVFKISNALKTLRAKF